MIPSEQGSPWKPHHFLPAVNDSNYVTAGCFNETQQDENHIPRPRFVLSQNAFYSFFYVIIFFSGGKSKAGRFDPSSAGPEFRVVAVTPRGRLLFIVPPSPADSLCDFKSFKRHY